MRFFKAKQAQGFTQLEIILTMVILGIVVAIATPSFLGWYETKQVEEALAELRGALQESQINAVRTNSNCDIVLTTGMLPDLSSTPSACLPSRRTFEGISLRQSNNFGNLSYNYLGETNLNSVEIVVLASEQNSRQQRCLVIAGPLGLTRTGTYLSSDTTGTDPNNCITR